MVHGVQNRVMITLHRYHKKVLSIMGENPHHVDLAHRINSCFASKISDVTIKLLNGVT